MSSSDKSPIVFKVVTSDSSTNSDFFKACEIMRFFVRTTPITALKLPMPPMTPVNIPEMMRSLNMFVGIKIKNVFTINTIINRISVIKHAPLTLLELLSCLDPEPPWITPATSNTIFAIDTHLVYFSVAGRANMRSSSRLDRQRCCIVRSTNKNKDTGYTGVLLRLVCYLELASSRLAWSRTFAPLLENKTGIPLFHSRLIFRFSFMYFIFCSFSPCARAWCLLAGACKCLNWIELNQVLNWIELNWIELNWIELNWIDLTWIELNWIELNWIELNWNELNWIA